MLRGYGATGPKLKRQVAVNADYLPLIRAGLNILKGDLHLASEVQLDTAMQAFSGLQDTVPIARAYITAYRISRT